MPDWSRKHSADLNSLAARIVREATADDDEAPAPEPINGKDPAAVALGRKGGLRGGKARAEKLTAEERSAIAKRAAEARWQRSNNAARG
ncbi:conserved hypothetical protein [uncultured Mycobacterium sp.]|uniref:Histone H1 n=1 Tax=uncultured Mycobacterium sp. TaxID=171292 RepID=A0A1Y5PRC4_9MYCO|nr:conserved hypothetical protein [uncultured Mycobacterium sp.]